MKRLILPLVMGLAVVSCSRDSNGAIENIIAPIPVETPILPTKIINTEEDKSVEISTFTYDGDKVVEFTSGYAGGWNTRNKWYYNAQGLIEKIESKDDEGSDVEVFTYDNQNIVVKVVRTSVSKSSSDPNNQNEVTTIVTRTISYAGNTVIIQEKEEKTNSIHTKFNRTETATYTNILENGQVIKSVKEDERFIITTTYEYDSKNGSWKNIKGTEAFGILEGNDTFGFKNNPVYVKEVEQSKNDGSERITESRNEFEYLPNGYPKKVTITRTQSDSSTGPSIETYEFEYNK